MPDKPTDQDLDWTTLMTDSTTDVFIPGGDFIEAAG